MVMDRTLRPESTAKAGMLEERGKRVEHEQGREGEVTGGCAHSFLCPPAAQVSLE